MKKSTQPPEMKYINSEPFELLGGNPDMGFASKIQAQKLAKEWLKYPTGGHARVINWKQRWFVYGN